MFAIALLLAAAQPAGPFDASKSDQLAREHCSAKWPDDFEMQEFCLKQQREGLHDYALELRAAPKPLIGPLYDCATKWTEEGVPDFEMMAFCGKQQMDAYLRLNSGD